MCACLGVTLRRAMPRKRIATATAATPCMAPEARAALLAKLHARKAEARAGVAHGVGDLSKTAADPMVHNVCKLSKRLSEGVISADECANIRRLQSLYEECGCDMEEMFKRVGVDEAVMPDIMRAMEQLQTSNASGSTALRSAATDVVVALAAKGLM